MLVELKLLHHLVFLLIHHLVVVDKGQEALDKILVVKVHQVVVMVVIITEKEELKEMMAVTAQQESDIGQWTAEEHKANKTVAMLTAQREVKAREAAKASANVAAFRESLEMEQEVVND